MHRYKEPKWRLRQRDWGNWVNKYITIWWVFASVLAAAALLGSISVPAVSFSFPYFQSLTVAIFILGAYSLAVFFVVRSLSWGLIWCSNFRPKFWFVPKVGNWFEVNNQNWLILNIALPQKTENVFLEYSFKHLWFSDTFGQVDYISEQRHEIKLIEPSRGSGGIIHRGNHSGKSSSYGILLGKKYRGTYALRLSDAFTVGYRPGDYEMIFSRRGEYRNWPFQLPDLSLKFSLKGGSTFAEQLILSENQELDRQSSRIKKHREKVGARKRSSKE